MKSDPQLRRWYLGYNRELFGGELPEDTVAIMWEPCGGAVAETQPCDDGEFIIRVNPCLRGVGSKPHHSCARLALIHEMAHVKLLPNSRLAYHGTKFDEEMQRLSQFKSFRKLL